MGIFLGHTSAAQAWRYAASAFAAEPRASRVCRLGSAPPSPGDVRRARSLLPAEDGPLQVLVPEARCRRRLPEARLRVWGGAIPPGSFRSMADDVLVSSPEFCFLQMASDIPLIPLIWLGCELCASYAVNPCDPADIPERRPPTSAARIARFLDRMPGAPGIARARRAARYVFDGAASPMEIAAAMTLCLPCSLGGFGLPHPQLNRRIDIGAQGVSVTGSRFFRCDLYWPEKKVALEYDSSDHHLRSDEVAADSARRNALAFLGITVVTMTTRHLYSPREVERIARVLARQIGFAPRPRMADYGARQRALRQTILFDRDFRRGFC